MLRTQCGMHGFAKHQCFRPRPPQHLATMVSRPVAGVPRLARFCAERKRPSPLEHYTGGGYTRRCKEYCREQFGKKSFAAVVRIMQETESRAKTMKKLKGTNSVLLRNKKACNSELRGMTLAFLEANAQHSNINTGVALPIREPRASTSCQNCSRHKRRIAELESRDVLELAAKKLVDEARRAANDVEWASVKRKLCSMFHPDKLHVCPNAGAAVFKALCNDARW